jgi:hypothetical protein
MNARWESTPRQRRHDHLVPKAVVSRTAPLVTFSALLALVLVGGRPAAAAHPGASESAASAPSHESASSSSSGGGSSTHESAPPSSSGGGASASHESGSSANGSANSGAHASGSSGGGGAASHDSGRGPAPSGPAASRERPEQSPRATGGSPRPAAPASTKPAARGETLGVAGSGAKGDERHPPEGRQLEPRPPHQPGPPPGRPINGQPRPPAQSGNGPLDPGVFYVYDNTSPESSYQAGEPCRVVCQSDPSVQCSSYTGNCEGLSDQVICDGQSFLCPGADLIGASDAADSTGQPALQAQAATPDEAGQLCEARDDRRQDRREGREHDREHGAHAGHREGCDQGCRQGQANAAVSCNGANAVP